MAAVQPLPSALDRAREVLTVELLREVFGVDALIDDHPLSGYPRITWITQA